MPKLPTPQSHPALPRQVFSGDQFGAAEGRALSEFGGAVTRFGGVLAERQTQKEISTLNAEIAKAQAELTVAWQERMRTADPNDTQLAENFQQEVQARLQQIGGMASTREAKDYFTRAAAGVGANFLVSTSAGEARLAELKAVSDFETTLNQFTDSLYADPMSFDTTLPTLNIMLDGFQRSGGLSTEARLKLQNDSTRAAARAAAQGLIAQAPEAAQNIISSGSYSQYLTADDKATLLGQARAAQRAQEAAARKVLEDQASAATSEYLGAVVNADGTINQAALPQAMAAIARDPRLANAPGADQQRTVFNLMRSLADAGDRPQRTDPATFQQLYARATLPPGDPNRATEQDIFDAVGAGRLTMSDANGLLDRRKGENTDYGRARNALEKTLFDTAARYLTGSADLTLADPEGALQYAQYHSWALGKVRELQDKGAPLEEIYGPASPLYSNLEQFKRGRQEVIDTTIQSVRRTGRGRTQPEQGPIAPIEGQKSVTDMSPAELDALLKKGQ